MKIRRFVAKDMRTALEQIKHELGADAVIMSNKKIPEGVELMAAVDYGQQVAVSNQKQQEDSNKISRDVENDVVSLSTNNVLASKTIVDHNEVPVSDDNLAAFMKRHTKNHDHQPAMSTSKQDLDLEQQLKNFTDRLEQAAAGDNSIVTQGYAPVEPETRESEYVQQSLQQSQKSQVSAIPVAQHSERSADGVVDIDQMRAEMASIRQLLEHQISGLMWQDMAQKDPSKALMVNKLMAMGIAEQVADQIASYIPTNLNIQDAWQQAKQLLASQLNTNNNEIIHRGGVVSLVGPTGVGKTTTIAKLAARFAQIHGADQVVLISTDSYRIAGFEQLTTYGRIIGCQVKLAKDTNSLDILLHQFSKKKLILIDTAGMGQRDMRLVEQLTTLIGNSRVRIRNYLVLAANTQQLVMQENVERFKKVPLAGAIFTKLDESLSVGEVISTAIQNGLPIVYLTDGQRVPEDIKVANAEKLVTLADKLSMKLNRDDFRRPMPAKYAAGL